MAKEKTNKQLSAEVEKLRRDIETMKIPVSKPGKVKVKFATVDIIQTAGGGVRASVSSGAQTISKGSAQLEDESTGLSVIKPYADKESQRRFFEQSPYNYRSLKLISTCIAGLGYNIVPEDSALVDYFDDSEYKKFKEKLDAPNEGDNLREPTTLTHILTAALIDKKNFGDGYIEVVRNKGGEVSELYHMRAYKVYPKIYYGKKYYIQKKGAREKWYRPFGAKYGEGMPECLNLQNYNPFDEYSGFPENYPATGDMILDRFGTEYNIKKFQNNLMIQFMIVCEGGEIDSDGLAKVTEFLKTNYKGLKNAGKVLYLNSDRPDVKIRIEKLDHEVRDASFQKLHEKARDNIIVSHGILGRLVGIVSSGSMGGSGEAVAQFNIFMETMIRPEQTELAAKLKLLFVKMGVTRFRVEFKEISIETFKELVEAYGLALDKGIIDDNEARQGIYFEPRNDNANSLTQDILTAKRILKRLESQL